MVDMLGLAESAVDSSRHAAMRTARLHSVDGLPQCLAHSLRYMKEYFLGGAVRSATLVGSCNEHKLVSAEKYCALDLAEVACLKEQAAQALDGQAIFVIDEGRFVLRPVAPLHPVDGIGEDVASGWPRKDPSPRNEESIPRSISKSLYQVVDWARVDGLSMRDVNRDEGYLRQIVSIAPQEVFLA
ncbi:uncharacterized protein B0I36DRAFT_345098 [Microdochium trichocladiopsis]|uniref:Uncharacterized protein n=1 Tax=Microdochium trichocladiopsis TaxID=1682393 RepID=A0A9P9BX61_9PEZI|nr:uncharacterized protein B0I36DRAFT_345098 [Microdochium trichocladiopsis]KAH7041502.1 hypothetical protein B0I36DRAFT_345098 [Microdochium trichocladiopsis]